MGKALCYDGQKTEVSKSLINRICDVFSDGIHFAAPISSLRTNEFDLVQGVLRMLQGFSSSLFYWDENEKSFYAKTGIYVTHLSHTSLLTILNQFMYAATCLQHVETVVNEVERSVRSHPPTLRAFTCSVSAWLKRLRDIALKEEMKICSADMGTTPTLLGLASSLSSLCSGAEFLFQIIHGAIPREYFESNFSVPAAELAVCVLDYLYQRLNEVCLVQGGEVEAYQMLLHIFVGSLLPYIEGLDSWLFEGSLDDPFEEMFFYANRAISVDEADFWEKSYLLRLVQFRKFDDELSATTSASDCVPLTNDKKETGERDSISLSSSIKGKEGSIRDCQACPLFIKDMSKSVLSAGKSLQLIRHVSTTFSVTSSKGSDCQFDGFGTSSDGFHRGQIIAGLTLSEIFFVSLAGLIGHGDHISRYFWQDNHCKTTPSFEESFVNKLKVENGGGETLPLLPCSEKLWYKFLVDTLLQKRVLNSKSARKDASYSLDAKEENMVADVGVKLPLLESFCTENPVITMCQKILRKNMDAWKTLNLSRNFYLPPLNDEILRKAVFGNEQISSHATQGTNYAFGFQFSESEYIRSQNDTEMLEVLFPFPTLLPTFQDDLHMSELLPFQNNSTLASRVLTWIQNVELRTTPLPLVIMQECLTIYVKKQVDYVGKHILSKLMTEWRLMDELAVLRAIYLLGSGDLLQHFLTVIFNKLDKGETWDDDFELNTILQESIRNSADGMLLSAPDALVVSIAKTQGVDGDQPNVITVASTPRKSRVHSFGIDGLDLLKFTYKVSWPLELIANKEAVKKYNQVMGFLLKVKRAKFVLDKARRWMWKSRGTAESNRKRHWLVEQKLLHFVDAFHQYVMDRVYHSAWLELCEGMAAARSLDEVIEVHEAYLLSIQRQCFVVPDKLWALIASRINSILGLALDFYSIQQTLTSGGAISAIKARCEMEIDRIEKQFDDCIAFLLRVLSFKLNVGHFPHLADLVTRINYNYFYMSDGGNLMIAPSSETVGLKLGKAFAGRTD
ncbi:gamma-tubulin complex component 5-like [Juglans microcarpa x Juglans regia]|uniref:gamma-tubulin complex component 5-like n=1 Tax=Juglans microcarpa x Juglans regia TaxID=2249226 RepID=UPI001B7E7273|nr:gamma-tubulin complex component 5-like [Juglans microcarpa x Juglans regia]